MARRVTTPKRPRKAATSTKKPRRAATKTARPRTRKTKTAAPVVEEIELEATPEPEPAPAAPILETQEPEPVEAPADAVIITSNPEPSFVARVPPPEPPRVRPSVRRGIFFDVENTSRAADISRVLEHLDIDWVGHATEFMAVGNWRVIGHDTARLLARKGAALVHSAPSVGVRDWSDLRIAVAAGVWLAGARPGDVVEIVSDDQAFDAVGDVAASLGVMFRRTSYRALIGGMRTHEVVEREAAPASDNRSRGRGGRGRSRRGGTGRSERSGRPAPSHSVPRPAAAPVQAAAPEGDEPQQTAPHDEIVGVVQDLLVKSPGGVSLDALANALRERGFSRPPGSPRLITRLRRIKQLDVGRQGTIRLVDRDAAPVETAPRETIEAEVVHEDAHGVDLNQHGVAEPDPDPIDVDGELLADEAGDLPDDDGDGEPDGDGPADDGPEGVAAEGAEGAAGEGGTRRRRRRGGRRRRGRRGGASAVAAAPADGV